VNGIQVIIAIIIGISISVIGQILVDWFRKRNNSVAKEDFEYLSKIVSKMKSVVEITTGITINGVDYRGKRTPPPGHDKFKGE